MITRRAGFSVRASLAGALLLGVACGPGSGSVQQEDAARRSAPRIRTAPTPAAAPARDLSLDEARGGHTLARHVGLTDGDLRDRLRRERRIAAASTYTDRATAERVVGAALADGGSRLERWRAREGRRPNLVLDFRSGGPPVGLSLRRRDVEPVPCRDAVVVLRWDEASGDFFVLTSYPEARP